jgi:hypothetical protein
MKRNEYSAGAVKFSFWFMEFRKVVQLMENGLTLKEIDRKNREENIFGAPTEARSKQIFGKVKRRIEALDESFVPIFMGSDLATQKMFCLAATLADDTLFFDFVYEVIREKMIIGNNELCDADVRIFFKNKQEQSEKVAGFYDNTLRRLGRSYKTMLLEAGMLDGSRILKPILDPELKHWLIAYGYEPIAKALEGIR